MVLWEKRIQCPLQVVDLLNQFVWNIRINDCLSLHTRLNVLKNVPLFSLTMLPLLSAKILPYVRQDGLARKRERQYTPSQLKECPSLVL
jgi:hypothetical protein